MKNLFKFFVEYYPKEFGRVELLADFYRNFSLKGKEQEDRAASANIQIASLKSKLVNNFHVRILRNCENKKLLLEFMWLQLDLNPQPLSS